MDRLKIESIYKYSLVDSMPKREHLNKVTTFMYLGILGIALVSLALNVQTIKVIHDKASEFLPVVKHATYTSTDVALFYVIIGLTSINFLLHIFYEDKVLSRILTYLTPVASGLMLFLIFMNPHYLLFHPTGLPPTHFDTLPIGGVIATILLCFIIMNASINLLYEEKLLKYYSTGGMLGIAAYVSLLIHECGHAVFVLLLGGTVTAFNPFPAPSGSAGYVMFHGVSESAIPLVLLGGAIFQWITLALLLLVMSFYPHHEVTPFLKSTFIFSWLDFPLYVLNNAAQLPHWFVIGSTEGDLLRFSTLTGFSYQIMIVLAILQLIIGLPVIYGKIFPSFHD